MISVMQAGMLTTTRRPKTEASMNELNGRQNCGEMTCRSSHRSVAQTPLPDRGASRIFIRGRP